MLSKRANQERIVLEVLASLSSLITNLEKIIFKLEEGKKEVHDVINDAIRLVNITNYNTKQEALSKISKLFFDNFISKIKNDINSIIYELKESSYVKNYVLSKQYAVEYSGLLDTNVNLMFIGDREEQELFFNIKEKLADIYHKYILYLGDASRKLVKNQLIISNIINKMESLSDIGYQTIKEEISSIISRDQQYGLNDIVRWSNEIQHVSNIKKTNEKEYVSPSVKEISFRPSQLESERRTSGINSAVVYKDKHGNHFYTKKIPKKTAFNELFVSNLLSKFSPNIPWNINLRQYGDEFVEISSIGGPSKPINKIYIDDRMAMITPANAAMYFLLALWIGAIDLYNPDNIRVIKKFPLKRSPKKDKIMFIDFELADFTEEDTPPYHNFGLFSFFPLRIPHTISLDFDSVLHSLWRNNKEFAKNTLIILKDFLENKMTDAYIYERLKTSYKSAYQEEADDIFLIYVLNNLKNRKHLIMKKVDDGLDNIKIAEEEMVNKQNANGWNET